ncbi:condensation domain-containing protein [Actinacidiphila glaucinigra]|uniref:Condensation domain-containing protein n=1 Tax=Actinacidiphila glaucinigra TaxID=235986 RepID=A0A239BY84_9ACTN|nr:condensation domain-containing protein [Actinacidiphila glaucinigra]SNS13015.1 Condensation domain-containing protein [Actinacidiphila glaucinigra]
MRRRLSPYERVIWAAGERLPVNIAAVARVEGRTTPGRVRAAVAAVRRRHPLLGVRVADPGWWQGRLTTAGVPDPGVRVVRDAGAGAWSRVVEEELPRPFDTRSGPLARFVLVDAGEAFDLVTVYHHLVADAVSAGVVLRDLLTHLGGPDPAEAPPPGSGPVPVLAAPADELIPGPRARPGDLLRTARALGGPVRPPYPPDGRLAYRAWSLEREDTELLLKRCRAQGATLQGALCAAFARAAAPGRPARIAVAADLRRVLEPPPGEAMGLYAASFVVPVDGAADDLWAAAREARTGIHARLTPQELRPLVRVFRLTSFLPHRAVGALLRRGESRGPRFDVSVSNTRLDLPEAYGPLRLAAVHGAAHTSLSGAPLVIVVGLGGRLFLSVTSTAGEEAEALCRRAMDHLLSAE